MAETLTTEELSHETELAERHERLETGQAAEEAIEEHHGIDRLRVRRGQHGNGRVAAVEDDGLIAALLHHVFDQPALYGVVIDNQNAGSHGFPRTLQLSVSNRGTLADAD